MPRAQIDRINDRISQLSFTPKDWGEPLHVLHYDPGQYFRGHLDVHAKAGRRTSSRVATCFLYLSDVEAGGETHFPLARKAGGGRDPVPKTCAGMEGKDATQQGKGALDQYCPSTTPFRPAPLPFFSPSFLAQKLSPIACANRLRAKLDERMLRRRRFRVLLADAGGAGAAGGDRHAQEGARRAVVEPRAERDGGLALAACGLPAGAGGEVGGDALDPLQVAQGQAGLVHVARRLPRPEGCCGAVSGVYV